LYSQICVFPAKIMSKTTTYLLVSLPNSIASSNTHDEALTALRSAVSTDHGTVYPFAVPEFKIGTLDALVQQADELARLEGICEGLVGKVGDSLRTILEGDEDKISQQRTVNDSQSTPRDKIVVC
jgi:V-type H+-transporting ATPase subunit C